MRFEMALWQAEMIEYQKVKRTYYVEAGSRDSAIALFLAGDTVHESRGTVLEVIDRSFGGIPEEITDPDFVQGFWEGME
jgi:hypothetical protein